MVYSYAVSGAGTLIQSHKTSDVHYVIIFDKNWHACDVFIESIRLEATATLITDTGDILHLNQGHLDEFGAWRFSVAHDDAERPKAVA